MANTRDRAYGIILALALVMVFALYCTTINPELSELSGDSARFLLLAKSLATGRGYAQIEKPGDPPHADAKPGLSVMIAPLYHFRPHDLRPVKLLMVLCALGIPLSFYLFLFREHRSARCALALTMALVPFMLRFQVQIFSDLPQVVFILLGFYSAEKLRDRQNAKFIPWFLAGIFMAAGFLVRQLVGLAFASVIASLLFARGLPRLKAIAAYALGFFPPILLLYLRNYLVAGQLETIYNSSVWMGAGRSPFANTLTILGMAGRVWRRLELYGLHQMRDLLLGTGWHGSIALWALLMAFLLAGFLHELLKRKNSAAIFFIPYLLVSATWQNWAPRYLLPLLPLALFFIYRGFTLAAGIIFKSETMRKWLPAQIFSAWAVFNLVRLMPVVSFQHSAMLYPPEPLLAAEKESVQLIGRKNFAFYPDALDWREKGEAYLISKQARYYHFFAMAEWARRNLRPEEVVVCRLPNQFAWLSGVKSIQYPVELDAEKFWRESIKRRGGYLLIEEISPELRPILFQFWQSRPEKFKLEKQLGRTYLLRIIG